LRHCEPASAGVAISALFVFYPSKALNIVIGYQKYVKSRYFAHHCVIVRSEATWQSQLFLFSLFFGTIVFITFFSERK
jgi:hypothetical protein